MSKDVSMATQSLKINSMSVTYNAGFTESQFYMVFPCPEKKKRGEVLIANTFENPFDDFVGHIKLPRITHMLLASE